MNDPPGRGNPKPDPPPDPFPLRTPADVVAMLERVANAVDADGSPMAARTLAYIASVSLSAISAATLEARVEALERELKRRSDLEKDNGR